MASSLDSQGAELLRLAGPSKRYGKLRLCFYRNDSDSELIKQFAAVTFVWRMSRWCWLTVARMIRC